MLSTEEILRFDREHIWHPYTSMINPSPVFPVVSAKGVKLTLADGKELIDGMSSWWCAIHGYNHPDLNNAISQQLEKMAHVMFGGLTHPTAIKLCQQLLEITHPSLNKIFLADSGSVSVEVAMKMAIQYWYSQGASKKNKMLTVRNGYHGDTFGAMSVCDPVTGMHHIFSNAINKQYFADAPQSVFGSELAANELQNVKQLLGANHEHIAAVIIEPIVQGTGGMRFYTAAYLNELKQLCNDYNVLLIFDEIATGFGRTGKLFAYQHSAICPDILCLGKSITGGYMTLAATLCNEKVSDGISTGGAGVFMHGPTFMANPLACAVASASIELLLSQPWQEKIQTIERQLIRGLAPAIDLAKVSDVRCLGAIGVIETKEVIDVTEMQNKVMRNGIWLRPFGKLLYTMPPYISSEEDIQNITSTMVDAVS